MKKLFLLLLLISATQLFAQEKTFKDVIETNKLYFYGYDFTKFKLLDVQKIGKGLEIKSVFFQIINFLNDRSPEKDFRRWFKKNEVLFVQEGVNKLNAATNADSIVAMEFYALQSHHIPQASLQKMINKYDNTVKEGIGFVNIIECFNMEKKETIIWFVFFDIATKKIIDAYENTHLDAEGYGYARLWGTTISSSGSEYFGRHYRKKVKEFEEKK